MVEKLHEILENMVSGVDQRELMPKDHYSLTVKIGNTEYIMEPTLKDEDYVTGYRNAITQMTYMLNKHYMERPWIQVEQTKR